MIDIGRLYCLRAPLDLGPFRDHETDRQKGKEPALQLLPAPPLKRKPVVFWNPTRACQTDSPAKNVHAHGEASSSELATDEAQLLLRDLASFGVRVTVLGGGEPLLRTDLLELIAYAEGEGIRPVLLTGGSLINRTLAVRLKRAGVASVFVSLEGLDPVNGYFRAAGGLLDKRVAGLRNCREAGLKVRACLWLNRTSFRNLGCFFDLFEAEKIERVFLCHPVDAGRPRGIAGDGLSHQETRQAMEMILERVESLHQRAVPLDIITADNHADGAYLYLKLRKKDPARAAEVLRFLKLQGGACFGAGVGLAAIGPAGDVHPDVFWSHHNLGNVRERPFSQIWQDLSDPLMAGLKDRLPRLQGRCAHCLFKGLCGGNLRVRADLAYGDPWASDPACYLTSEEVRRSIPERHEVLERNVQLQVRAA